jgi:Transposase zinc-ribbon domain
MPRNRVQHQKDLSDDAFEQRCPDEEACRGAWFAWRCPEGFKCPRCAATQYCEIRERQLLQCRCRGCRYQTSLIAGSIHERVAIAAMSTPPMPYRLLKLA